MKVNIPSPKQARVIAHRLARKIATARMHKIKTIKKEPKSLQRA
jgi:hypothetical protein